MLVFSPLYCRSPNSLQIRFILLCRHSSSEFLLVVTFSNPFKFELIYLGFRSSSRHHSKASTTRKRSQHSLRSVLRLSQPLNGLLRSRASQVYFTPQPRPGLSRSGASLSVQHQLSRRKSSAPMLLKHSSLSIRRWSHDEHLSTSRLCSTRSRVPSDCGLGAPSVAPLVGLLPTQVSFSSPWLQFPDASAHVVRSPNLR